MRPIFIRTKVLQSSCCSGSAFLSLDEFTKILVAVQGPHAHISKRTDASLFNSAHCGKVQVHVSSTPFLNFLTKGTHQVFVDAKSASFVREAVMKLGTVLSETFHKIIRTDDFPHTIVKISVTIIEWDLHQQLIDSAIICVSAALADACIPLHGFCTADVVHLFTLSNHKQLQSVEGDVCRQRENHKKSRIEGIKANNTEMQECAVVYHADSLNNISKSAELIGTFSVAYCGDFSRVAYLEYQCNATPLVHEQIFHAIKLVEAACRKMHAAILHYFKNFNHK